MTVIELGALGEFAGAILLFGSLVFVGFQIRQNTNATRAVSHHTITDALNQVNFALVKDEVVARLWSSGLRDRSSLDEVKIEQFDALFRAYMHVCDTMYYQAQVGAGDQDLWKAEERYLGICLNSNGGASWWAEHSSSVSSDFRNAIEDILPSYASSDSDAMSIRYGLPRSDH
jgi:hypothetical protein